MKLMLCIIQDQDSPAVLDQLRQHGLSATKLASTGGFLRQGNTTLVVGVNESQTEEVLSILRGCCQPRQVAEGRSTGGAIVFVVNVARFDRV